MAQWCVADARKYVGAHAGGPVVIQARLYGERLSPQTGNGFAARTAGYNFQVADRRIVVSASEACVGGNRHPNNGPDLPARPAEPQAVEVR